MQRCLFYLMLLFLQYGCASRTVEVKLNEANLKMLSASGYSYTLEQSGTELKHRARLNAYKEIARQLYREPLANGLLVADQVMKHESYRHYMETFLRQADVLEEGRYLNRYQVVMALHLSQDFYRCFNGQVDVVERCIDDSGLMVFSRTGVEAAKINTVNLSCVLPDCSSRMHVAGFNQQKSELDKSLLEKGLYDSEGTVNLALRTALRYFIFSELIFNQSYF